jgi:ribose transport system permease protein
MVLNGILAVGMMFAIITGGIDLSIGCTFAITGIGVATLTVNGVNPFLAILFGLAIGVVLGIFNGFLVTYLKLQPFIATLGTMSLYRGIAYVWTGGQPVTNVPDTFRNIFNGKMFAGIRFYVLVMIIVFVIAHIILSKTRTGDYLYAVGGNEEAAKLSGVNTRKVKFIAYTICSVCAAVAGLVMLASLGSAESTAGAGYETNAIAAAAIGGTRMAGGRGTALGTFIGALMLAVLKVGMVVINVDSFWQYVVTGIIIIVASYFEFIRQDIATFMARKKA